MKKIHGRLLAGAVLAGILLCYQQSQAGDFHLDPSYADDIYSYSYGDHSALTFPSAVAPEVLASSSALLTAGLKDRMVW